MQRRAHASTRMSFKGSQPTDHHPRGCAPPSLEAQHQRGKYTDERRASDQDERRERDLGVLQGGPALKNAGNLGRVWNFLFPVVRPSRRGLFLLKKCSGAARRDSGTSYVPSAARAFRAVSAASPAFLAAHVTYGGLSSGATEPPVAQGGTARPSRDGGTWSPGCHRTGTTYHSATGGGPALGSDRARAGGRCSAAATAGHAPANAPATTSLAAAATATAAAGAGTCGWCSAAAQGALAGRRRRRGHCSEALGERLHSCSLQAASTAWTAEHHEHERLHAYGHPSR